MHGNVEAASLASRPRYEAYLVSDRPIVAVCHLLEIAGELRPKRPLRCPTVRDASGVVNVVLDRKGVTARDLVNQQKGRDPFPVLVVSQFLQHVDQLVLGEVQLPVKQGDAETFGRKNKRRGKHTEEQEKQIAVTQMLIDVVRQGWRCGQWGYGYRLADGKIKLAGFIIDG